MYAETSGSGSYGKSFDLDRSFPAGQELYGVTFQYHMYGATMGSAILESSAELGLAVVQVRKHGKSVAPGYFCVLGDRPQQAEIHVHVGIRLL